MIAEIQTRGDSTNIFEVRSSLRKLGGDVKKKLVCERNAVASHAAFDEGLREMITTSSFYSTRIRANYLSLLAIE